jgi:glycosyltransferase involved in cell wall biosynthesis
MGQRILLDGFVLRKSFRGTGINRYLINLLREFEKTAAVEEDSDFQVLVPSLRECGLDGRRKQPGGFAVASHPFMRFHRVWKYGLVNSVMVRAGARTVFVPIPVSVYLKPRRLAITVHDIIPLVFPEQHRSIQGTVFLHTYTSSMRRADLILTDSACSKADMVSRFGVPEKKITVAYLGFDAQLFRPDPAESSVASYSLGQYGITKPYLLHVGRAEPRKNLVKLVEAYDHLTSRRKDLDVQLVLSGPLGWGYEPLLQSLKKPSLQRRVILTGRVPDHELAVLYRSAACFVMPSLYEGFGLPALEAMASGTPLVSSNRSSLPEVAGEAALYFDPESVEEMSAAMERLLTDRELRARLVATGLKRACQFSWQQCAHTTLAALRSL